MGSCSVVADVLGGDVSEVFGTATDGFSGAGDVSDGCEGPGAAGGSFGVGGVLDSWGALGAGAGGFFGGGDAFGCDGAFGVAAGGFLGGGDVSGCDGVFGAAAGGFFGGGGVSDRFFMVDGDCLARGGAFFSCSADGLEGFALGGGVVGFRGDGRRSHPEPERPPSLLLGGGLLALGLGDGFGEDFGVLGVGVSLELLGGGLLALGLGLGDGFGEDFGVLGVGVSLELLGGGLLALGLGLGDGFGEGFGVLGVGVSLEL
ncbi:MAG: hypothetical protein PVH68_06925, partial [Armatimonadota bacterium]